MGLTRRSLLITAVAAPLVACTQDREPPPPPDPDDVLRDEAAERERALLRDYDAVLLAVPALAARLAPLRAEHEEHLVALTGPSPSAPAAPSPSAAPGPAREPAAALARLAEAERAAAAAHGQAALAASRELAAVLGSLSASESSHVVVLR